MDAVAARTDLRDQVRSYVDGTLRPLAARLDVEQSIPRQVIDGLGRQGYLGAAIRQRHGGMALDAGDKRSLHEELARAHGSLQNLVTVAGMVAVPLQRFGHRDLKQEWLPAIASGERVVAFAVTEPEAGSSLSEVRTRVEERDGELVVDGEKTWTSFAQVADGFLVLGRADDERTAAALVPRHTPGLVIEPIGDMLGLRANMLGRLHFDGCRLPLTHRLGRPGSGVVAPVLFGLDEGRFTTACGSVGLAQAALDLALDYARRRSQGGSPIYRHQLVQKMISEMVVAVKAARLLCVSAAEARDRADADMIEATLIAKYHASRTARLVTDHAVQIHGANGCQADAGVERLFRDAKMMEVIEGTTQVHEVQIALSHVKANPGGGAS